MFQKIYLHLLILCGILCQGIIAALSDDATNESSNLLTRKRRVITHNVSATSAPRFEDVSYIVRVIEEGNKVICTGAILSHHTVITVARCVPLHETFYKISAGSGVYKLSTLYTITSKIEHYGNPPQQQFDGIALITVNPPFIYSRRIKNIPLYSGPLAVGTPVTVYGWGHIYPPNPEPISGTGGRLIRAITLPIINLVECESLYRQQQERHGFHNIENPFVIKRKHLCTYDPQQYCARTDAGAPLVYNHTLAGIHVWKGEFLSGRNPDVFIDLRLPEYSVWIRENTR